MKLLMQLVSFTFVLGILAGDAHAVGEFECRSPVNAVDRERLLDDVEMRYRAISDLTSEFQQNSFFLGMNQRVLSRGTVHFKKPGMMDWTYEAPEKQRFVADGKTLWFFQPDLNQVTVGDFTQSFSSELPVSFLLGMGNLKADFSVIESCTSEAGVVIKLQPKVADQSLDEFYLLVEKTKHSPLGAKIVDVGGNETAIVFEKTSLNTSLKEESFKFEIPKGVDVIDRRVKEADIAPVQP